MNQIVIRLFLFGLINRQPAGGLTYNGSPGGRIVVRSGQAMPKDKFRDKL